MLRIENLVVRYGAETRIGGLVRNHVLGMVAAHEEIVSPLELALELGDGSSVPTPDSIAVHLNGYAKRCATPGSAKVLAASELEGVLTAVQRIAFDKTQLESAYAAARSFRGTQTQYLKKSKE